MLIIINKGASMDYQKNDQQGFGHVGMLAVIAVVAVVGFAGWRVMANNNTDTSSSIDSSTSQEIKESLATDLSGIKSIEEIQSIATLSIGDLTIVSVELKTEDGVTIYEVELSDGSKLHFDALTGESVAHDDHDDNDVTDNDNDDEDGPLPVGFVSGITVVQAIDIAKAKRPSSTVERVNLEVENGVVVYRVRFTDDSRVYVNATTGEVQRLKDETGEDIIKDGVTVINDEDDSHDDDDDDDDDDEHTDGSDSGSSN